MPTLVVLVTVPRRVTSASGLVGRTAGDTESIVTVSWSAACAGSAIPQVSSATAHSTAHALLHRFTVPWYLWAPTSLFLPRPPDPHWRSPGP